MYYLVAIQANSLYTWRGRSTVLNPLSALFQFLRLYWAHLQDRLRVFSPSSREDLNGQSLQKNMGLESNSITAAQFLQTTLIPLLEVTEETSVYQKYKDRKSQKATSITVTTRLSLNENSERANTPNERDMNALEKRRVELEYGQGGDHDSTYIFALPTSMPQALAWIKLLVRVQHNSLHP